MDYFLPSWYQAKDSWDAPDQLWYQQDHQRDFDDTISQVRMFIANQQPVCLVVPAYFPNLRYFLYRQKILETKIAYRASPPIKKCTRSITTILTGRMTPILFTAPLTSWCTGRVS